MKIINLTRASVSLMPAGVVLPPDPRGPAHVSTDDFVTYILLDGVDASIPVVAIHPVEVMGLPPPVHGVRYLVSRAVLDSPLTAHRDDLVCADDEGFLGTVRRLQQRPWLSFVPTPLTLAQREAVEDLIAAGPAAANPSRMRARAALGLGLGLRAWRKLGLNGWPLKDAGSTPTDEELRAWQEGNARAQTTSLWGTWRGRFAGAHGEVPAAIEQDLFRAFGMADCTPRERDAAMRRLETLHRGGDT